MTLPTLQFPRIPSSAIVAGLTLAVFLADLATPHGVAMWLFYALPMFTLVRLAGTRWLPRFLALVTMLVVLDHFLSGPGAPIAYSIFNRAAGLTALWLLGGLLIQREGMVKRLRDKRLLLETVVDTVPSMVVLTDPDGRIEIFNRACEELTGYDRQEVIGRTIPELFLPQEWIPVVLERFADPFAPAIRLPHENPWRTKSGEERLIEWRCAALPSSGDGRPRILGAGIDITERRKLDDALHASNEALEAKVAERTAGLEEANMQLRREIAERQRAEEALRASESLLKTAIDNMPIEFWARDREQRCIMQSALVARNWGDQLGKGIEESGVDEEAQAIWRENNRRALAGEVVRGEVAYGHCRDTRWCFNVLAPVRIGGEITGMLGINIDITEQKRAETALRASEERFRTLFEAAPAGISIIGRDSCLIKANGALARMLGYSREELVGMSGAMVTHPDDVETSKSMVGKIFSGELPSFEIEKRYIRKNGEMFWGRLSGSLLRGAHGRPAYTIGIIEDITERKEAERKRIEFLERQRDALVREVHHRIKNNLQGVVGLLRHHVKGNPELREPIEVAVTRVNSIALVHGLHGGSKTGAVSVCDILLEISRDKERIFPEVPLEVSLPDEHRLITIAEKEAVPMALIINELVINAIKACLKGRCGQPPVQIHLIAGDGSIGVGIRSMCGNLPEEFDFARGIGLGAGLQIVKSMMPPAGARLDFIQLDHGGVEAVLMLTPPVLVKATSPRTPY